MTIVFPHVDPEPLWVVVLLAIMLLAAEGGYQLSRVRATRTADGVNHSEDLNLACRNAVLAMLDLLGERGYTREQAYIIASVAVDLRISNVVDVPNVTVSALLPEDIFQG